MDIVWILGCFCLLKQSRFRDRVYSILSFSKESTVSHAKLKINCCLPSLLLFFIVTRRGIKTHSRINCKYIYRCREYFSKDLNSLSKSYYLLKFREKKYHANSKSKKKQKMSATTSRYKFI